MTVPTRADCGVDKYGQVRLCFIVMMISVQAHQGQRGKAKSQESSQE
jgi:hypothetical protein